MTEIIKEKLEKYRSWMIDVRRHLHEHPELGDCEYETSAYIERLLGEMGIETARPLETGVVGVLDNGRREGRCIAIRADIDALPIDEESDVTFKSQNPGMMHACGHDMHMASALCAARILSDPDVLPQLTAPVKFIFQPAEETDGGAQRMIEAGCLEAPDVAHVIGYHVAPEYPAGKVAIKYGYTHASSDMFEITVHGVKSHGAYPNEGVDAILAASHIVTALQSIVSRNVDATDACVITVGVFSAGSAGNVLCDEAVLKGTMRTTTAATRELAIRRLKEVASGVAAAMGASADVVMRPGYIAQHNDDAVVDALVEVARETVGEKNIVMKEHPTMGVEDFAFYSAARPSGFFFVGTGYEGRKNYGIHHGKFEANEAALDVAVQTELELAWKLMNE